LTILKKSIVVCLVCLFALPIWSQSKITHEEATVRKAYAKLSYLTQLTDVGDAAIRSYTTPAIDRVKISQQMNDAEVRFNLSDFKVGDISEIANIKWGELISPPPQPNGEILAIDSGTQRFQDHDRLQSEWRFGKPHWQPADRVPASSMATVLALTVQQHIQISGKSWTYPDVMYDRYASFSASVTFQGKTAGPYNAVFFFGKNAKGQEVVAPQDNITDGNALFLALTDPLYPRGLLETHLRETPVVSEWILSNEIFDQNCSVGKRELCCSGTSKCGISHDDLQRELGMPLNSSKERMHE